MQRPGSASSQACGDAGAVSHCPAHGYRIQGRPAGVASRSAAPNPRPGGDSQGRSASLCRARAQDFRILTGRVTLRYPAGRGSLSCPRRCNGISSPPPRSRWDVPRYDWTTRTPSACMTLLVLSSMHSGCVMPWGPTSRTRHCGAGSGMEVSPLTLCALPRSFPGQDRLCFTQCRCCC
jgi:hypothetical protein